MDLVEEAPFPPPAPVAAAPPPASAVASLAGPRIFVLSPLPGNKYEVDRYFYSPRADVTKGDYAALLAFATHYAYPLAILQCPDLAAFQASNPDANVRPFVEVPASIIKRGRALMLFRCLRCFSQRRFGILSVSPLASFCWGQHTRIFVGKGT